MRWGGRLLGVAAAVLLSLTIGAGSRVAYRVERDDDARIRLSWRAAPPQVEECRAPTEGELAGLPLHMRPSQICEGRSHAYRLRVTIDGESVLDGEVGPSGARRDGPVYVYHEFRVRPGAHRLKLRFEVESAVPGGTIEIRPLAFDGQIALRPREVALLTRTEEGLVLAR